MAILPRTLLTQPASAAVAAVSLFGFTIVGLAAQQSLERQEFRQRYAQPCAQLNDALGDRDYWGAVDYTRYALCFEASGDDVGALEVASEGVERYPHDELLINIKGYHLIGLGEYEAAIDTLQDGLNKVQPRTGTMENNLAWAYLFVGRGAAPEAAQLYRKALERSPRECELIHTGMFVEFEQAAKSGSLDAATSMMRFADLQSEYAHCEMRNDQWTTAIEAIGAEVLYQELNDEFGWEANSAALTFPRAVATTGNVSATRVCAEAMPIARLRGQCVDMVESSRSN